MIFILTIFIKKTINLSETEGLLNLITDILWKSLWIVCITITGLYVIIRNITVFILQFNDMRKNIRTLTFVYCTI